MEILISADDVTSSMANRLTAFRREFPALRDIAWLDTAAVPPAANSVISTINAALKEWQQGTFDWLRWEGAAEQARASFARLICAESDNVGLVGSLAEAAGIVAASIPRGRVLVSNQEFRSNLFPWLALERSGFDVLPVDSQEELSTQRILDRIDDGVVLVAISEVQSSSGARIDAAALAAQCDRVGARLFLNVTQSVGALRVDVGRIKPHYLAAHAYKWLLAPRGAGFLFVRDDLLPHTDPVAPNWKNVIAPYDCLYGGPYQLAPSARRIDASLAWFSWVGANAALELIHAAGPENIEAHSLQLGALFRQRAINNGWDVRATELPSQLVSLACSSPVEVADALLRHGVKVSVRNDRLRLGFHGFNSISDLNRAITVIEHVITGTPKRPAAQPMR